jgi:transposase
MLIALRALAKRAQTLTGEERELKREIEALVQTLSPPLLAEHGVGPISAAQVMIAWSHQGRVHSEAAFARLGGAAPIPASSGQTVRNRLDRGGDRKLNRALTRSSSAAERGTRRRSPTSSADPARARVCARRSAASSATSPATSTACSRERLWELDTHRSI